MAVGVRLDDRQDRKRPDAPADRLQVLEQEVEVDLRPGRAVGVEGGPAHSCRHSSSSNFVYSRMNAMSIVPIGPLRCLAIMIWARPRFSSVGL